MKSLILIFLLLSSAALLAEDTIRVELRVLELPASARAPTEFPAADSTPLSSNLKVKLGEVGRMDLGTKLKLRDVTSEATTDIPLGISVQVTPVLKGAQLTYRAQVTHSVPVFSTRATFPVSAAEIQTCSFYQSGPCEAGKPVWFNYRNPENGNTMFIALRLTNEAAQPLHKVAS